MLSSQAQLIETGHNLAGWVQAVKGGTPKTKKAKL